MGTENLCKIVAEQLVGFVCLEDAIPESLSNYALFIRDAISIFLSRISYSRLKETIMEQSVLNSAHNSPAERLLNLALHFPTLHKLGQIIARRPGLDPIIKNWLVCLESGIYSTDMYEDIEFLTKQLADVSSEFQINFQPRILAEASVATIVPFTWIDVTSNKETSGVFKVLKPKIKVRLYEELEILKYIARYFEDRLSRYGLQQLQLTKLFQEISAHLAREIDLVAEQDIIAKATSVYDRYDNVRVPQLAPFCRETITAMEHIKGVKITEIEATAEQRTALARLTFETIICRPLFWPGDRALFHGDPHAGNILATVDKTSNRYGIALVDWTLAGFLSKTQRAHMMELMLGILTSKIRAILSAMRKLAVNSEEIDLHSFPILEKQIKTLLDSEGYQRDDHLKKTFRLLEEITLYGVVFPSDLILFRKAFFTLEGVLNDISPDFALGKTMESYLANLLMQEMPFRILTSFSPVFDKVENYHSLLTNQDLYYLYLQTCMVAWSQQSSQYTAWIETMGKFVIDFSSMPKSDYE
ncbi:MAG: hypothetical protein KJO32_16765 [Deltaproteobacteria bacterium]|nr:hypothetical protein [Deltaproteobacteria bacterium]